MGKKPIISVTYKNERISIIYKNDPKSARKYKRNVLMPPGHPIILLKSNCVVPENIHTPPPPNGRWKFKGGGGVQRQ